MQWHIKERNGQRVSVDVWHSAKILRFDSVQKDVERVKETKEIKLAELRETAKAGLKLIRKKQ